MDDKFRPSELIGQPQTDTFSQKVMWVFWGSLALFLFCYAIRPIYDTDFWWHLKTGEVMVHSGGLLQADPFTYAGDGVTSARESLILKGYWLWQVTAYGFYSLLGFFGISLLKFITVGAMAGVVIHQMRRQQVGYPLAALLLTLGFILLRATYVLERPQIVSFLFAGILLGFIAHVRSGGRLGWPLPVLMLAWANLHGGFVVGDLILMCFAAGAVMEYRRDFPRLRHLLGWSASGVGASLLNPNGALAFSELLTFHNSELMTWVSEYESTWLIFQQGSWSVAILWLLFALYGVGIWSVRRLYWPEVMVALFLAWFSAAYVRNVGFFAIAMLPSIGYYLQQGTLLRFRSMRPLWGNLPIVAAAAVLLWQTHQHWQIEGKEGPVSAIFPDAATEFIKTSGLAGRMFNSYNAGGYFLWKLYPQYQVLIDGRGLDVEVFRDSRSMAAASLEEKSGRKEFEVLLDRYGIDYVVQPHVYHDTGRLTPLLKFLLVKPEWIPVYLDQQSHILVHNAQTNVGVIERFRMDKFVFNNKLVGYLTAYCNSRPADAFSRVALTELLIFVGRYDEAEARLAEIARLQADNANLLPLRRQLDALRK